MRWREVTSPRHQIVGSYLRASMVRGAGEAQAGLIFGRATQVVPGASIRAHVSLESKDNPPPVELPSASTQPVPPSVTQEAALSLPGIKDPPDGTDDQYRDVLPLPLVGMFNCWVGSSETIEGGKEPDADAYEGESQWERHPVSEASSKEEEEEGDGNFESH